MLLIILFNFFFLFLSILFFGRFIGHFGIRFFLQIFTIFNFTCVVYIFYLLLKTTTTQIINNVCPWFIIGLLHITWSFIIDDLIIIMLLVVNFVSFCVHIYSLVYMYFDPHFARFMSYLSLFTFFMLLLVTADNFVILFFGWEGVGICSYLLINFWYTRLQANKAALKAVFINRVSDSLLIFGILACYSIFKSLNFSIIFLLAQYIQNIKLYYGLFSFFSITFISFFLYCGAVGKSAQILLHTWLPDAMEGPTPVSALIHAATMVTAGVFLIVKASHIIGLSLTVLTIITFSGVLTSIFAATSGLLLMDIKKIIAYSTCSQLGYMVFICGIMAYNVSLFHLFNHALFKALLFLGAGSIIHAINNEQNILRTGNLLNLIPFTYVTLIFASLAIGGFPFLTGFYSKDIIFENTIIVCGSTGFYTYSIALTTAFFTIFYSFKIIHLVFFNSLNLLRVSFFSMHDAQHRVLFVLFLLFLGSIFNGYLCKDLLIGFGSNFLTTSLFTNTPIIFLNDSEFISIIYKILPLILSICSLSCYFFILFNIRLNILYYNKKIIQFLFFFLSKWYFDKIYNIFLNTTLFFFAKYWVYKITDKGLFELYGPFGTWKILKIILHRLKTFETGNIFGYLIYMVIPCTIMLYFFTSSHLTEALLFFNPFWIFTKATRLHWKWKHTTFYKRNIQTIDFKFPGQKRNFERNGTIYTAYESFKNLGTYYAYLGWLHFIAILGLHLDEELYMTCKVYFNSFFILTYFGIFLLYIIHYKGKNNIWEPYRKYLQQNLKPHRFIILEKPKQETFWFIILDDTFPKKGLDKWVGKLNDWCINKLEKWEEKGWIDTGINGDNILVVHNKTFVNIKIFYKLNKLFWYIDVVKLEVYKKFSLWIFYPFKQYLYFFFDFFMHLVIFISLLQFLWYL